MIDFTEEKSLVAALRVGFLSVKSIDEQPRKRSRKMRREQPLQLRCMRLESNVKAPTAGRFRESRKRHSKE